MTTANIIIFSKDRPMQLNACLESLLASFKEVEQSKTTVIYKASNDTFKTAYHHLSVYYQYGEGIRFVEETAPIKQLVLQSLYQENPFTFFLVDDIIFKDKFSLQDDQINYLDYPGLLTVSLRLDKNINHCYATNTSQKIPSFLKKCVWDWRKAEGDWNYPASVDGNIYKTSVIADIVQKVDFTNPNDFEAVLDRYMKTVLNSQFPYMCCYVDKSKLLNVPANRVQNNVNNRFENSYSSEELLKKFNEGYRLDIRNVGEVLNTSCHWPLEFEFWIPSPIFF